MGAVMLNTFLRCSLLVLLLWTNLDIAAQQTNSTAMVYEAHNQIDPKPLKLHSVVGFAKDDEGNPITAVTIGLFTEDSHVLVATTETDHTGNFAFLHISPGRYRIVAKYLGFCPANVPVVVEDRVIWFSHRILRLQMRVRGIDTCSYGILK